jgi:hypothetical protein
MANLTGGIAYPQPTSVVVSYSSVIPEKIALGTRARDAQGNEYVYVDFDAAKAVGEIVTFDTAYLATATGATTTGYLGVVCGEASSSDKAGWIQIYGVNTAVLASSSLTSGWLMVGATTDGYSVPVNTSLSTGIVYRIAGMNAATSASTATSPGYASTASSILGVFTAILNYPFITPDVATS